MMRKIAGLTVLLAVGGFTVAPSLGQEKEPAAQERREHQKAQADVPAEMSQARESLESAMHELERAGDEWGGHRVAAIGHVKEALAEIHKAEEYARQHKLVK